MTNLLSLSFNLGSTLVTLFCDRCIIYIYEIVNFFQTKYCVKSFKFLLQSLDLRVSLSEFVIEIITFSETIEKRVVIQSGNDRKWVCITTSIFISVKIDDVSPISRHIIGIKEIFIIFQLLFINNFFFIKNVLSEDLITSLNVTWPELAYKIYVADDLDVRVFF